MKPFLPYTLLFLLLICCHHSFAKPYDYPVALSRQYAHYKLDKIQQRFLAIDGKADSLLTGFYSDEINRQLTYCATVHLDSLQKEIELDSLVDNNRKLGYLRGLGEMLDNFSSAYKSRKIRLSAFPEVVRSWEEAYTLDKNNQSIESLFGRLGSVTGNIFLKSVAFANNPTLAKAKSRVLLTYINEHPGKLWQTLNSNPDAPFVDSLIAVKAKTEPEKLYNYAQANNRLGKRIQQHKDPLVRLVSTLSADNSGRLYFPFLGLLSEGKITLDEIKKQVADTLGYYRLLVSTQITYASRMAKGDTPMAAKTLREMIHTKAVFPFVNSINGLHEMPANVRFKKVEKLTAQELYYILVSSEAEIYTSSYIGVYNRIWQRMGVPDADSLLASVSNDHYKKFLTMAANYNVLDDFLGRMNKDHAIALMTNFVDNLDNGNGDDLEDAVDVANSYASITNDTIKKLMLDQIAANYFKAVADSNERGTTIYHLEKMILESSDTANHINLTDSLGVLPVYDVANNYLKDSLGRIVLQMYFYGDGIGRGSFNQLNRMYSNKNWKRTPGPEWVQFTSLNTVTPFIIFANKPGFEEKNEDLLSQEHLNKWMTQNGYAPAITVHRGHSYYLNETIRQLSPSSKIIILGSCGAYHSLRDILEICPDAYLIGSKQTGFGAANVLIFSVMTEELKNGRDINWITYWKLLQKKIPKTGYDFNDYIPPYKNLGALFINAYHKARDRE